MLMANPVLRDEVWNAVLDDGTPVLSEHLKFFLTVHSPENEGAAKDLVRHVVHDVVTERYLEQGAEMA